MQAKSQLALVVPTGERRAVSAGRRSNADYRKREYLTLAEIEKLIEAAKGNRYGHRDATMILVAFQHGFRASEIIELEWSDIDFNAAEMHVERKKRGKSPRHPIAATSSGAAEAAPRSRIRSRRSCSYPNVVHHSPGEL